MLDPQIKLTVDKSKIEIKDLNMKKILLTLIILMVSVSLFASYSAFDFGGSASYSSVLKQPTVSLSAVYRNFAESNSVKFGFSGRAELGVGLKKDYDFRPIAVSSYIGAGMAFDIGNRSSIYLGLGPAVTLELKGKDEKTGVGTTNLGVGLGADLSYGYYFSDSRNVGITAGVFGYGTLFNFGSQNKNSFQFITGGFVGMSFGFGAEIVDAMNVFF